LWNLGSNIFVKLVFELSNLPVKVKSWQQDLSDILPQSQTSLFCSKKLILDIVPPQKCIVALTFVARTR
jgi:hypothetical protein